MIHDVTLTLTIPSDRLAELADFLLERTPSKAVPPKTVPAPRLSTTSPDELDGGEGLPMTPPPAPEKPAKPKRKRRTKAEMAAARAAEAAGEPAPAPTPPPAAPKPPAEVDPLDLGVGDATGPQKSLDDVRAAVSVAVEKGGLDRVAEAFRSVGASRLSDVKPEQFAAVIEALLA